MWHKHRDGNLKSQTEILLCVVCVHSEGTGPTLENTTPIAAMHALHLPERLSTHQHSLFVLG
jgi:hypothetical protein